MEKDFSVCPHCAVHERQRILRPATARTPHISRSDGQSFHLFLEESTDSRPSGATDREVAALFRYDFDPAGEISESVLVTIRPAGVTDEIVLTQLQQSADRLAAILEKGDRLQKTYTWRIEANP